MASRYGLEIRAATAADAAGLSELLRAAGQTVSPAVLAERLDALRQAPGAALVAMEWGPPSGLVLLHWYRSLDASAPTAQITTCHAAETIPNLEFWYVSDHSLGDIWANAPAFTAYRGTDWMQEPCRSCDRREKDWGGCRCQALALAGDAAATDPACSLSPLHAKVRALAVEEAAETPPDYIYRTIGSNVRSPFKEDVNS